MVEKAWEHGYAAVTPAMARLFGNMGGQAVGLSELSRQMGVSRQAVYKLGKEAARLGLVEFVPSPEDAKVMRLQFTHAGWTMSARAAKSFDDIEAFLKERLGPKNLAELKRLLALPWDDSEGRKLPAEASST